MLTSRGRRTIALALVGCVVGRILGVTELFGLAAAAVIMALAALLRVRMAKGTVTVTARAVPPIVSAGQPAVLELTIEASGIVGSLSAPVVLVTDPGRAPGLRQPAKIVVPRLTRGDRARVSFALPTERRGLVDAGGYEAAIADPLGLARRRLSTSRPARCVVLPRVEPLATVVPRGLGWVGSESTRSAAERLVTGSSMLRRYAQGDDLRRIHWRTTARVGELMVREGGDRDDPDRISTTVMLDAGGTATPPEEVERAVEVAASVLTAAADESSAGVSGAYRLVTTTGLDSGGQRGNDSLQSMLIALAGVEPASVPARERWRGAVEQLGRPDHDEVLIIAGAFGEHPPDPVELEDLARAYSAVVLVLVGVVPSPAADELEARWQADAERAGSRGVLEIGAPSLLERGGRSQAGVLTVPLPLGRSLAAAWSLDLDVPDVVEGTFLPGGVREATG